MCASGKMLVLQAKSDVLAYKELVITTVKGKTI